MNFACVICAKYTNGSVMRKLRKMSKIRCGILVICLRDGTKDDG